MKLAGSFGAGAAGSSEPSRPDLTARLATWGSSPSSGRARLDRMANALKPARMIVAAPKMATEAVKRTAKRTVLRLDKRVLPDRRTLHDALSLKVRLTRA